MTQWWPIAPYDCANAALRIAANSIVMARLDPRVEPKGKPDHPGKLNALNALLDGRVIGAKVRAGK
ncbi:MAG: hypothetical protein ACLPX9_12105 [Rhodomicrobium sp.]